MQGGEALVLRSQVNGEIFFVSESALNSLLEDDESTNAIATTISTAQVRKIRRSVKDHIAHLADRPKYPALFDDEGCVRLVPGQFRERSDPLRTADELVSMARLPLTELARRAPHVVLVEIVEVVPGWLSLSLESMVEARIIEVLKSREGLLEAGSEFLFTSQFVDIRLGEARYCAKHPDFLFPRNGARALLLLPDVDPSLGLYSPHAVFELTNESIRIHPYSFILQAPSSVPISGLRKALLR